VSIIPHINILLHGGDEYDFITALAEIIDNSIQNTVQNEKTRNIDIKMTAPTKKNQLVLKFNSFKIQDSHSLEIFDNGIGMFDFFSSKTQEL
jgi:sensor histidine kinase regulating citrate/malate metabolism